MNPNTRSLIIVLLTALILNTGCGLIYKQNVQQGNAHEQEDLDQVELGMTKKQVAYLLGTPAIHDPFHQDRWDYISMFSRRGGDPVRRLITLTFKDDLLVATDGIGESRGGDIKALEETRTAVAKAPTVELARVTRLITDDAVINWTLQLGAFGEREDAEELASKLRASGYPAKLAERVVPGLGTRHQVRVGLYDTFNEAQDALRRVESELDITGITVPVDFAISTGFEDRKEPQPPAATGEPEAAGSQEIEEPAATGEPEAADSQEIEEPAPASEPSVTPVIEGTVQAADISEASSIEPVVVPEDTQDVTSTAGQADAVAQDRPQYYVQVGSFSNPANADALVARLSVFGLNAFVEKLELLDEAVFKVRLGPEDSYEAAAELVRSMKSDHDLDAFVIPED